MPLALGCLDLGKHTLSCQSLPAEEGAPARVQLSLGAAAARLPGVLRITSTPPARPGEVSLFLRGGAQRVRFGEPLSVRCAVTGGDLSEGADLEVATERPLQFVALGPAGDTIAGPIDVRPGAAMRELRWRAR